MAINVPLDFRLNLRPILDDIVLFLQHVQLLPAVTPPCCILPSSPQHAPTMIMLSSLLAFPSTASCHTFVLPCDLPHQKAQTPPPPGCTSTWMAFQPAVFASRLPPGVPSCNY
uniref:(northern house mosquito) hypothetical protein n=1 Tax=Culex pipiens TaxID=7175 RepID=A0A8D8JLN5_CULPI